MEKFRESFAPLLSERNMHKSEELKESRNLAALKLNYSFGLEKIGEANTKNVDSSSKQ